MENKIKVTVEYEKPNTNKFDSLMAEYEAAKKYADATVAYYKPLADVAEDVKFEAILEQLETIKGYARRISEISGKATSIQYWFYGRRFDITYNIHMRSFEIKWGGDKFTKELAASGSVLKNWEELEVYKNLEKEALLLLEKEIKKQKERADYEKNRLYGIIKGGM